MAGSIVQSQQRAANILRKRTPASFPVAPSSRIGQQQKLLIKAAPASNEPTSPRCDSCGSVMTLRSTKYDKFWRCSRFPNCKGIQNAGQEGLESTISTVEHAQMGLRVKQPERAIPKATSPQARQPAPKVILHRPLRREEASSNRSEQSQGNLSQDCQPVSMS